MPQDPQQAAQIATGLLRQGRSAEAAIFAENALTAFPGHPAILRSSSEVFSATGDHPKALEFAQAVAKLAPNDPGALLHLAHCQTSANDEAGAILSIQQAAGLGRQNPMLLAHAGLMLFQLDETALASELYRAALTQDPSNGQTWYQLALAQQSLGDLERAEASCDAALKLRPDLFEVHMIRSRLRRQTAEKNHVEELEQVISSGQKHPLEQAQVCYALAKEFEDLENFENSFKRLRQGADTYRQAIQYSVEPDLAQMQELRELFPVNDGNDESISTVESEPSSAPIFVLGLPRTGTTLVERILASHSQVTSAGELPNFGQQVMNLIRDNNLGTDTMSFVARAMLIDPAELGRAYVKSVGAKYKATPRFVDKLPANFLNIGFIHRALPNARIIELVRHPMDACYAMYKTMFNNIFPATYQFDELAQYYVAHHRLMDHWRTRFPGAIVSMAYEDMVSDQEAQSRRLLAACGLDWEDGVLEFHKTKSASATASAAQVRQPIYSSSIQLWRRYERELASLAQALEAAGIDIS